MNPTEPRPISGEPFSAVQAAKSSESSRPGPTTEFRFSGEHLLSAAETSLRMRADNHHRQRDRETHPRPLCHLKTSRSKPCHLRELSHSRGEPRQTRTGLAVTENPFFPFHRERCTNYLKLLSRLRMTFGTCWTFHYVVPGVVPNITPDVTTPDTILETAPEATCIFDNENATSEAETRSDVDVTDRGMIEEE